MKKILLITAFTFTTFGIVSCGEKMNKAATEQSGQEAKKGEHEQLTYQCPMDCEDGKIYDKPGICPVCEMDLAEVKKVRSGSQ